MDIKKILGIGLGGRLSGEIDYYKKLFNSFDPTRVFCRIDDWTKFYKVNAYCYCEDANRTNLNTNFLKFYSSWKKFKTLIEAQTHLETEIRSATKKHPKTKFYREKYQLKDIPRNEYCLNGKWYDIEDQIFGNWCSGCKNIVDDSLNICPNCGEPIN